VLVLVLMLVLFLLVVLVVASVAVAASVVVAVAAALLESVKLCEDLPWTIHHLIPVISLLLPLHVLS